MAGRRPPQSSILLMSTGDPDCESQNVSSHRASVGEQNRNKTMVQAICMLRAWVAPRIESERGATMLEYGLLVTLIAVVVAVAAMLLGASAVTLYNSAISSV